MSLPDDDETWVHDVAVVGAGPIGLELAAALRARGFDYAHFEAGQVGHTMSWWPPGTRWFSSNERIAIAGVPLLTPDQSKATREQYLTYLRTVATTHGLQVRAYEPVTDIARSPDGVFTLTSRPRGGERRTRARAVVLAVGGTDFPRAMNVPGEDLPFVTSDLGDPHRFFRQRVIVVGGKNSAVESALRAHHAGATVSLAHRGEQLPANHIKYWLMPEMLDLLKSGRIKAHFNRSVERVHADGRVDLLSCVDDGQPPRRETVEADFVLKQIGYEQDKTLLRATGLELNGRELAPRHDPRTMETTVPGLYVAGTAVGGTQGRFALFLENCHVHVARIVAALSGQRAEAEEPELAFARPES